MSKIRAIALREYLAAVKSKAFVITILLMPVLMTTSIGLQLLFKKLDDAKEKRFVVIDRTQGRKLVAFVRDKLDDMAKARVADPELAAILNVKATIEEATPSEATPQAMAAQRHEISRRIEKGEVEALFEIGPDVLELHPELFDQKAGAVFRNPEKVHDSGAVRFQAKGVGAMSARRLLEALINEGVRRQRLEKSGINPLAIDLAQAPVAFKVKSLTRLDPATGEFVDAADETKIVNLVLPGALIGLMFMVIMIGATPAMHGILEEKSQRIAEVLLGSVTPFQLMAGKLLGVIGVALTMAAVYLGGGYVVMSYYGYADLVPVSLLAWFLPMLLLALLIFGSLFIAIGAAASDVKDTQTLLMPIMLIACLPMFALGPIMQEPNGPIAKVCSFFPFATPMLLVARHAVPPGVPWPEMLAGIVLVLATTWLCVWAASRIFRVGILMQGKGPRFTDLVRWAIKG